MRVGFAALARPTFDVALAETVSAAAWGRLDDLGHDLLGTPGLILEEGDLAAAIADASPAPPLLLWAAPEARSGGRLRLNGFCGINPAGHRL